MPPAPPPAPPGEVWREVVTFKATIAGSLEEFDQDAYRSNLATWLGGVRAKDIRLVVSSGSIVVTATIRPSNASAVGDIIEKVQTMDSSPGSESTLSDVLGVTVVSFEPAVSERRSVPDPSLALGSGSSSTSDSLPGIVAAAAAAVLLCCLVIIICARRKGVRFRREPRTTSSKVASTSYQIRPAHKMPASYFSGVDVANAAIGRASRMSVPQRPSNVGTPRSQGTHKVGSRMSQPEGLSNAGTPRMSQAGGSLVALPSEPFLPPPPSRPPPALSPEIRMSYAAAPEAAQERLSGMGRCRQRSYSGQI